MFQSKAFCFTSSSVFFVHVIVSEEVKTSLSFFRVSMAIEIRRDHCRRLVHCVFTDSFLGVSRRPIRQNERCSTTLDMRSWNSRHRLNTFVPFATPSLRTVLIRENNAVGAYPFGGISNRRVGRYESGYRSPPCGRCVRQGLSCPPPPGVVNLVWMGGNTSHSSLARSSWTDGSSTDSCSPTNGTTRNRRPNDSSRYAARRSPSRCSRRRRTPHSYSTGCRAGATDSAFTCRSSRTPPVRMRSVRPVRCHGDGTFRRVARVCFAARSNRGETRIGDGGVVMTAVAGRGGGGENDGDTYQSRNCYWFFFFWRTY